MLSFICFIYFIFLFIFPITLSVLTNFIINKSKFDEIKNDLKYFIEVLLEIVWIFTIICFIDIILSDVKANEIDFENLLHNIAYFSIFFSLIIFVNYFSTGYLKFKICIKTFLDELVKFINNNFILNVLFFTLLVFVKTNNDLTIGLIGSYFFFALTNIHDRYIKSINKVNKEFELSYKIMQIILNLIILKSFVSVERIISQWSQSQPIVIDFKEDTLPVLILGVLIIANAFFPQIKTFFKRLIIYIKDKINKKIQ